MLCGTRPRRSRPLDARVIHTNRQRRDFFRDRRRLHARVALLACAFSVACGVAPAGPTRIRVNAETLPWTDVSRYQTYRWWQLPLREKPGYGEREALLDWRVRQAVDRELAGRGYAEDTAGSPDFVVRYNVRLREESTQSFRDYLAYRVDGGGKDMGESLMGYEEGTLTLEVVDVASRRIAWRAMASAVIEKDPKGKLIDPAVAKMMERFPAGAR
jgi:hypothetical protein